MKTVFKIVTDLTWKKNLIEIILIQSLNLKRNQRPCCCPVTADMGAAVSFVETVAACNITDPYR